MDERALELRKPKRSVLGDYGDESSAFPALLVKVNQARGLGKKGVIAALTHSGARMELGPSLSDENLAGVYPLSAEALDAETFGVAFPPVL